MLLAGGLHANCSWTHFTNLRLLKVYRGLFHTVQLMRSNTVFKMILQMANGHTWCCWWIRKDPCVFVLFNQQQSRNRPELVSAGCWAVWASIAYTFWSWWWKCCSSNVHASASTARARKRKHDLWAKCPQSTHREIMARCVGGCCKPVLHPFLPSWRLWCVGTFKWDASLLSTVCLCATYKQALEGMETGMDASQDPHSRKSDTDAALYHGLPEHGTLYTQDSTWVVLASDSGNVGVVVSKQ